MSNKCDGKTLDAIWTEALRKAANEVANQFIPHAVDGSGDDVVDNGSQTTGQHMIGKYCIVRTYSAGVHAGTLTARNGREVVLNLARRIYRWEGAATLSQLARDGTSAPNKCKFPAPVNEILLTEAIEVIPCTDQARVSIEGVDVWAK